MTRRRGRRSKKLLDDLKNKREYCQLKEEALDRTMWRNRFGRGFGPVVWQITDDDDDDYIYIYIYIIPILRGKNFLKKLHYSSYSTCLHHLWGWKRQSVPKRPHINFRSRGITQKKEHNIHNTVKILNQEIVFRYKDSQSNTTRSIWKNFIIVKLLY